MPMQNDIFFRSEDFTQDELMAHLVETSTDRHLIDVLKGRSPVILKGSRGVGKSFLLRAAEAELTSTFNQARILPVYVTFATAGLIKVSAPDQFLAWMIAKIYNSILRAANTLGIALPHGSAISDIYAEPAKLSSVLQDAEEKFEQSWQHLKAPASLGVTDPELLRELAENLCTSANLGRIALLVDEAAHVFIPEQQRQFFTLMRALRSPHLVVKAAVYPGVTAFGPVFQPIHDATTLSIDRSVTDRDYAADMRAIASRHIPNLTKTIETNGEAFDALAYAATGNPRILLKTLARSMPLNTKRVQETIREYYRHEIWSEHSSLAERYAGHRPLIDWGRQFIEAHVLPSLHSNNIRLGNRTSHIWMHRDAPEAVREALHLLCYSGILQEGVAGIKSRDGVGTRYTVNLGCHLALGTDPPIDYATKLRPLSAHRMIEFGISHDAYRPLDSFTPPAPGKRGKSGNAVLDARLQASSADLDLTQFQHQKLRELKLRTIGEVLATDELSFRRAKGIGPVRARQVRNAAVAAVLEYLSG